MAARLCEYAKNSGPLGFKWMNCMLCQLYLSKSVTKIMKAASVTLLKSLQWLPLSFRVECRILAQPFKIPCLLVAGCPSDPTSVPSSLMTPSRVLPQSHCTWLFLPLGMLPSHTQRVHSPTFLGSLLSLRPLVT